MPLAAILIALGAAATLAGIGGILWCILAVRRARRSLADDAALRRRMQRIVSVNMGALLASTVGLMLVVLGIVLQR